MVVGGGTRGQGVLIGGWDGRMSCTGSLLRSGRIPNSDGVLEQGGASAGGGLGKWDAPEEGAVPARWGGDSGLKPRPFSCNHVFIDDLGAFEDAWVGVGADARVGGRGERKLGWGWRVAGRVCWRLGGEDVLHRVFLTK